MSLSASSGKLTRATRDLRNQWRVVRESWDDDQAQQFEEQYLTPLFKRLHTVQVAVSQMNVVVQKAQNDCA